MHYASVERPVCLTSCPQLMKGNRIDAHGAELTGICILAVSSPGRLAPSGWLDYRWPA